MYANRYSNYHVTSNELYISIIISVIEHTLNFFLRVDLFRTISIYMACVVVILLVEAVVLLLLYCHIFVFVSNDRIVLNFCYISYQDGLVSTSQLFIPVLSYLILIRMVQEK